MATAPKTESTDMKITSPLLILVAVIFLLGSAGSSNAQYRPTGDDGITASPKVRQFLNERAVARHSGSNSAVASLTGTPVYRPVGNDGIAASPKLRQFLAERKAVATPSTASAEVASAGRVGYRPVGDDGIAASPKLRQMLREHRTSFQIAPLK